MITAREKELITQNEILEKKVDSLQNQLEAVIKLLKGKKSEKLQAISSNQLSLFDLEPIENNITEPEEEEVIVKKKRKGNPKRKPLPENLDREVIEIHPDEIPEGSTVIGKEITEVLEIQSARIYVKQYVRFKYALPKQEGVIIGDLPNLPIHKGNAGASLLAFLLISKYIDHLPWYRIIKQFTRLGITLSDSTINGWFKSVSELLKPLYEQMAKNLLNSGYTMADESPIPVLEDNKKGDTYTGYFWVYYCPADKILIYKYAPGRAGKYPKEFLENYAGYLQTDAYAAYNYFDSLSTITLLACMAHARRKFVDAKNNDYKRAKAVLDMIAKLYMYEKQAREEKMTHQQRFELRQKFAKPIMDKIKMWLDDNYTQVIPKSKIGKAISYSIGIWDKLERYLEDGKLEIDNNLVENSIRPMAIGRKNYMFCGNHASAQNAAMIYSLLGTCLKNNINPNKWLKFAIEQLPYCKNENDYLKLLPQNFK